MKHFKAREAIKQRISVRRYAEKAVEDSVRTELDSYIQNVGKGPFGVSLRFRMLDLEPLKKDELKRLVTYGFIKGARLYVLGATRDQNGAFEDLGYCFEKIILKATSLGLGTCWLGGSFRRSAFASRMDLDEDELLPVITPVGYPAQEVSTADRLIRFSAGSQKRKPWSELFFAADGKTPLTALDVKHYETALEAVRMGPSASNRQPWRIIKDDADNYHFYLQGNKLYNRLLGKMHLQNVDLGIAMCHFELVAHELGLAGRWAGSDHVVDFPGLQYIATWSS